MGVPGPQISIVKGDRESGRFAVAVQNGEGLVGVLGVNASRDIARWRRQIIPVARVRRQVAGDRRVTAASRYEA